MIYIKIVSVFFGLFCIAATLLPILKNEAWWIRICDFPRLQLIFISFITLVPFFYKFDQRYSTYIFLFFLCSCIVYQIIRIYPYTPLAKPQVLISQKKENNQNSISIIVCNVMMTNKNSRKCIENINKKDPDIILLLEADKWWQAELEELEKEYLFKVQVPLANTYGMLLYSKLKLVNPVVNYLIETDVPSIHCKVELRSGDQIMFHGIHPRPPSPQESKSSLPRDAELIVVGKSCKASNLPNIVAGDLNDVAWSHSTHLFQRISNLLDPRIGRGMYSTFNANYFFLRWPLDHVFISREFKLLAMERLQSIESDHFPIYAKFSFEPEMKHEQPAASSEDKKEAQEKIEKTY